MHIGGVKGKKHTGSVDILRREVIVEQTRLQALDLIGQAPPQRLCALRVDRASGSPGGERPFERGEEAFRQRPRTR